MRIIKARRAPNEKGDVSLLSEEICQEIEKWLAKYPEDQRISAVMAALMITQEANEGWLSEDLINAVAAYLDIPNMSAYEVASFYSMYELEPVGRHKLCVCTNIACMLRGSDQVVEQLEGKLGIKMGQTTPDGRVTLKHVECLGACANAPMMQIGKKYHEDLTPEKIDSILAELE